MIIIKILLVIPGIFVILTFCFYLSTLAPGDHVMEAMDLQGRNTSLAQSQFDQYYLLVQSQLGLDKPNWYFSIYPSYQPKSAAEIVPKAYRENLLNINKKVKNWSIINNIDLHIKALILESQVLSTGDRRLKSNILNLQKINDFALLREEVKRLSNNYATDNIVGEYIQSFDKFLSEIQIHNSWYYPKFQWNGGNNQFHYWMKSLFSNQSHLSLRDGMPVNEKISQALLWTLSLGISTLIFVTIIALVIALIQVYHLHSIIDKLVEAGLYILYAVPLFWLATLAVIFLTTTDYGTWTHIFPSVITNYRVTSDNWWQQLTSYYSKLTLPILCMTLSALPYLSRQLKLDISEELQKTYVLQALVKGVSTHRAIWRHALPNALTSLITILTGAIPRVLAGSLVIEYIFSIPGMGYLMLDSIYYSDWPVVFSIVALISVITMSSYLLAEVLYLLTNPKLRHGIR